MIGSNGPATKDPVAPRNRAERRERPARRRVDLEASAELAAKLQAKGLAVGGTLADAALCHERRQQARKTRRKTARAARRRNRAGR